MLATARRRQLPLEDTRLGGLALALNLDAESPVATIARAQQPEHQTTRDTNDLLIDVFFALQDSGELSNYPPVDLRADRFGLQRSHIRVDAMEAPRSHPNPGIFIATRNLVSRMEVVIAPEVEIDPDFLIEATMKAELVYSEKLTRTTSVVVCNETTNLRGKAVHAARKGIPLLSDTEFLDAASRVQSTASR